MQKFYEELIAYDDSDTTQKNKIDEIIHNYIDFDKCFENNINMFIEHGLISKKAIDQFHSLSKSEQIEGLKRGLQYGLIEIKNKANGRKIIIDIDKDIKYLNDDKADVTYTIKADDEKLLDKYHAILEKIDKKWKIVSIIPSDSDLIRLKKQFHK